MTDGNREFKECSRSMRVSAHETLLAGETRTMQDLSQKPGHTTFARSVVRLHKTSSLRQPGERYVCARRSSCRRRHGFHLIVRMSGTSRPLLHLRANCSFNLNSLDKCAEHTLPYDYSREVFDAVPERV